MDIVFVGVNYRTPEKALSWARSIASTNPNCHILLADNSREDSPELRELLCHLPRSRYVDTGGNLGYLNAAAYALSLVKEVPDWVIVSNVDIELETEKISDVLTDYTNFGAVAPAIISESDGFDKNPYRLVRPSKRVVQIKNAAFSNRFLHAVYSFASGIRGRAIRDSQPEGIECEEGTGIYLPYGACFILSRKFFETGCSIRYPLFLYGEELYIAEQCRRAGLDIAYVPSIRFLNYEHASTSFLGSEFVRECNRKAYGYILSEFY